MADDAQKDELDDIEQPKKKGMKLPILIGIIVGIIVLQAGIVWAAIHFVAKDNGDPKDKQHSEKKHDEAKDDEENKDGEAEGGEDEEGQAHLVQKVEGIFTTKNDLYINPRNGANHIIVLSVGIEISPKEKVKEVEEALIIPIQDRVIARVSNYTVDDLQRIEVRDSLRTIIKNDIKPYFRGLEGGEIKLRNVYFPKFVIQ